MPMQVLQGMPVQGVSPKNGKNPVKNDPGEFLNALAALLLPNAQPQPAIPDQINSSAENLPVSSMPLLSLEQPGVNLVYAGLKKQEIPKVQGLAESLVIQAQGSNQPRGDSLFVQETAAVGNNGQLNEESQIFSVLPSEPRLQATVEEGSPEFQGLAGENQPSELRTASELRKTPEPGEGYPVLTGDNSPNDSESLPLARSNQGKQEFAPVAGSKSQTGFEWTDDGQTAREMKPLEEEPAAEKPAANQEIRSFAEHLAKDILPGRESKAIPAAEFQVAGRELAQEFPRIIESQLKNQAGQEIKRDVIIHLEPKELGKLTVKVTAQEGIISVQILAEQSETRNLVESGLANLRQSFSEQGIKYGRMEVEIGGQSLYQQQHSQHQQNQQQQQQQNPLYWTRTSSWQGNQWQELVYPDENKAAAEIRFKSNAAVDYRV